MKTILVLALCLLSAASALGQNPQDNSFSEAFEKSQVYKKLSQKAWNEKEHKVAEAYRDSTTSVFINSLVEPYIFKDLRNKTFSLASIDKPVVLSTSASWCAPCIAEIPAYNKIVEEYADKVTFVILFHDTKKKLGNLASKYNEQAILVPATQRTAGDITLDIAGFRHDLGYPANYYINTDRRIMAITLGAAAPGTKVTTEQAYQFNYEHFKKEIDLLLSKTQQL